MNSSRNISESFLLSFCHYLEFPADGIDCSISNPELCVQCLVSGGYFSSENADYPPPLLYFIWFLLLIFSLFGLINNIIIMAVIQVKKGHKSFDFLLGYLAGIDFLVALLAASGGTSNVFYFGDWAGRGQGMLYWCYISVYLWEISRSISAFTTILITLERYLFITFPQRAPHWFTPTKTKMLTGICFSIALLLGVPRLFSFSIVSNAYPDVPSLAHLEYVAKGTDFGKFLYQDLQGIHNSLDYWFPPPAVILLQLLSYIQIVQLSKRRAELTKKEKGRINAVKMFLPVTFVCLLTNIVPIVIQYISIYEMKTYRELYLMGYCSFALNSAVNLPIYYFRSDIFKEGTQNVLRDIIRKVRGDDKPERIAMGTSSTASTGTTGSDNRSVSEDGPSGSSGVYFVPSIKMQKK